MTQTRSAVIADLPAAQQFQLVDAYLYQVEFNRRAREAGDPANKPTLAISVVGRNQGAQPDRQVVIVAAEIVAPYNDNKATAILNCAVAGVFRILDADLDLDAFAAREALVIVYPYLRSAVGQIWRSAALQIPPLPVLDVVQAIQILDENIAKGAQAAGVLVEVKAESKPAPKRKARAAAKR